MKQNVMKATATEFYTTQKRKFFPIGVVGEIFLAEASFAL